MAHTVMYPTKNFFYPIGNTSAVILTDTLAPEEPANLLLLGCGDPRNIFFTLYNQAGDTERPLDFTCCDVEPAVLARNVLLFTMVTDNKLSDQVLSKIWNSFFHFFLDEKSHSFLVEKCQTLIKVSESITAWNNSKYAKFIRMCNGNTLLELRRHWELYVQAGQLSPTGKNRLKEMVMSSIRTTRVTLHKSDCNPCRSAGPYFIKSTEPATQIFQHYWKTGITSFNPPDVSAATLVNPTFVYSLTGEGFALHYGTSPILPFHLAPAFLDSERDTPTAPELVGCAKSQFSSWLKHFHGFVQNKSRRLTIRLFAGDALFFCKGLIHHVGTRQMPWNLTVAPWNANPLALDGGDYEHSDRAPTTFNIIETSNIMDHVGLLNVLVAALPLLSPNLSATLLTEALLFTGEDATKSLTIQFCADVSTMSLLLDLAPINYLSNFNTRSNAEEIMVNKFSMGSRQYHERIVWKRPTAGDSMIASQPQLPLRIPISFEPQNLGRLLFDVYLKMFTCDDTMSRLFNSLKSLNASEIVHYVREAFAVFLAIIRWRVDVDWNSTMASFFARLDTDRTLLMGTSNYQDLCTHLHLAGVYDADFMRTPVVKLGRFHGWDRVPLTVSIILVVHRDKLTVLSDADPNKVGTPVLHGNLRGKATHNIFASLRVGFGKVTHSGTDANPGVVFEPDPSSWAGTSPLIVSFSVPSRALHIEHPDVMFVTLSLRSTPATSMLIPKLGMFLTIFSSPLMDRSQVFVVPDEPRGLDKSLAKIFAIDNHQEYTVFVETDVQSRRATSLTARANITDVPTRDFLSGGAGVSCRQASPCVMEVKIGETKRSLVYPFPVMGSHSKLRIARKSFYVEVVVPIAEPLQPDGYALDRFPIPLTDKVGPPWNLHHLQLNRLPILDVSKKSRVEWISAHLGLTMTDRERALRKRGIRTDTLTNVKTTIQTILVCAAGVQEHRSRVFALSMKENIDTVIFVPTLRFDLASHTLVADAYVLPLNDDRLNKVEKTLVAITRELVRVELWGDEVAAWKQLLPALAERCRTWNHGPNCEFLAKKVIPLSLEHENDPLCSCGKGKDISAAFMKEKKWWSAAPFVTRIAIGPIFGVPYVESVGDFANTSDRCARCGGLGKPKLLICGACKSTNYCSGGCQKEDWKTHKLVCKK